MLMLIVVLECFGCICGITQAHFANHTSCNYIDDAGVSKVRFMSVHVHRSADTGCFTVVLIASDVAVAGLKKIS